MLAAHRLSLIDGRELYRRVAAAIKTVDAIPDTEAGMRIDTRTGQPVGGAPGGSGAALVSALELVAWSYPANSREASVLLDRWRPRLAQADTPADAGVQTDLERASEMLVRAAIAQKGDSK
jgi:hypothetical protein